MTQPASQQLMRFRILAPPLAILFTTALAAQKTWIVDAAFRTGTHFGDIQPAFNAASPGDTVLVRNGAYNAATTSKGLRFFGEAGTTFKFTLYPKQVEALIVKDLPAGQRFVMKGFGVNDNLGRTILLLLDNKGSVHLENLRLNSQRFLNRPGRSALAVLRCPQVSVTGCTLIGRPPLGCDQSTITIVNCALYGDTAGRYQHSSWPGQPGLSAVNSNVMLARSSAKGGDGFKTLTKIEPAAPALVLQSSNVTVSGDWTSALQAGIPAPGGAGMPAIQAFSGTLVVDPSVQLVPRGTAPKVTGPVVFKRLPSLWATGARPSDYVSTDLYSVRGSMQILAASLPGTRTVLPFGELWVDPGAMLILDIGVVGPREHRRAAFRVPPLSILHGLPIALQAINRLGVTISLSNPVVVILY